MCVFVFVCLSAAIPTCVTQHAWTYKPLAHDVLGMRLNRITVEAPQAKAGQPPLLGAAAQPKSFEVCRTISTSLPDWGRYLSRDDCLRLSCVRRQTAILLGQKRRKPATLMLQL